MLHNFNAHKNIRVRNILMYKHAYAFIKPKYIYTYHLIVNLIGFRKLKNTLSPYEANPKSNNFQRKCLFRKLTEFLGDLNCLLLK